MRPSFVEQLPAMWRQSYDSVVEIRHDLHAHPELSFEEHRTTDVIRNRLVTLGWHLATCPTETGAIATLRGGRPGRRVMIRADIDGLPVTEERASGPRSVHDGVMHACGHDVHTAGLLGVADLLTQRQADLAGEFTLLFQPAEESLGGARAMIDAGTLDQHPVDVIIGAHVTSLAPLGVVAMRSGVAMSAATALNVHVTGRGGHGAMAGVEGNVVLALSSLAPRLSEVVEGLSFEGTDCACSAGVLRAGTANNVVPRHALARGTLRTVTPDQRLRALARLTSLLEEIEVAFHVSCRLELGESTPAVTNHAGVTERVRASAQSVVGSNSVLTMPPAAPSDDMAEFLNRVPGCYIFVGGALDDGSSGMHHSPDFAVADDACRVYASVLATAAVELAQS